MNKLSSSRLSSTNMDLSTVLGSVILVDSFNSRVRDIITMSGEGIPSEYDKTKNLLYLDGFFDVTIRNYNTVQEIKAEHISLGVREVFPGSDEDFLIVASVVIEDLKRTVCMAYMFYLKTLTGFSEDEEAFLRKLKHKQVRTPHDYAKVEELESKKRAFRLKKKEEFSMRFNQQKGYSGDLELF